MELVIPILRASALIIALAGMFVATFFVTRNKDTPKEIFAGILSFLVGGAIDSALLATPVVILAVMPLSKMLGIQTEPALMLIDVHLYAISFVISGVVCWKGVVTDMRIAQIRTPMY